MCTDYTDVGTVTKLPTKLLDTRDVTRYTKIFYRNELLDKLKII